MMDSNGIEKVEVEIPTFTCLVNGIPYVFRTSDLRIVENAPYTPSVEVTLIGFPSKSLDA